MPFVEVVTSIAITYASSEYLYGSKRRALHGVWVVSAIQLCELILKLLFQLHMPTLPQSLWPIKVMLVATSFTLTLWFDVTRKNRVGFRSFLLNVGQSCLVLLPVCPWLSVLISCGFFVLISIFDVFGLNTNILNWPIYYGTLYGPFAFVYLDVKKKAASAPLLPHSTSDSPSSQPAGTSMVAAGRAALKRFQQPG